MHQLITQGETIRNYVPIGSIDLKLAVAKAEGYEIRMEQTRFHHVFDGVTVTSVDESKPTYYYYNENFLLPMLDAYQIAMEFYLKEKIK
jgi:hypothetical protein